MLLGLASVAMLFMALTSAFVVRQGQSAGWQTFQMPSLLWLNTVILLGASFTLEMARRSGFVREGGNDGVAAHRATAALKRWLTITLALGLIFLAGQLVVWRILAAQGIYIDSHPKSSFYFVMTGLHAAHLLGGIAGLAYLTARVWMAGPFSTDWTVYSTRRRRWFEATALYWHFMDGLWVYLLVLLFAWK
jgi:cytochrome c oxidase subunit 3